MPSTTIKQAAFFVASAATLAVSVVAQDNGGRPASPFANPQNLQALPQDISPAELRETMRGFSFATGLRCDDCHVRGEGAGMNFPSDDKRHKRVARQMIRMVAEMNASIDAMDDLDRADSAGVKVSCATCHRGVNKPILMTDLLDEYKLAGDADGAVARYSELREEFYGSHSYDFSPFTLGQYAEDASREGHVEFALALHKLNLSFNPDDAGAHRNYAGTLMVAGDLDGAIAALERAAELNPDSGSIRRLLERARSARPE